MNRREVIKSMALVSGHFLFPSILTGFLTQCTNPEKVKEYSPAFFTSEEWAKIPSIIDIIIPATATKSASDVNTHIFLDQVFSLCMTKDQQQVIREGLNTLIPSLSISENPIELLKSIDKKAYENDEGCAYFKTIKQYTLIGFFTSQEGITKASNYVKFPGDFLGDIPLQPEDKNYGKTTLLYYI